MNRHLKYMVTACLAVLVALPLPAALIDADAAHAIAQRFMARQAGLRAANSPSWNLSHVEYSEAADNDLADYYVFNASDSSAWVIIAGDDRAHQVLAYGETYFNISLAPDNVRWLLDQYVRQIEYLHAHPTAATTSQTAGDSTIIVPQLLTTTWGQRSPYRDMCPVVNGKHCVSGCVPTAAAQVMNYWKFPSVLPALSFYMAQKQGILVPALPAVSVEWDLMLDSYKAGQYNVEQGAAVALLMRYCGQSCKTDYTIASSGAWVWDMLKGLKTFDYSQDAAFLNRDDYSDGEWRSLLIEDLTALRPVIYVGSSSTQNHCFVIDGYDGSKFHVNWGWDGMNNGYYELDAMNGGGFKPTYGHQMLHGVQPNDKPKTYLFDFIKDDIAYNITEAGDSVIVTHNYLNPNVKAVVIADTVRFNGTTRTVAAIGNAAFMRKSHLKSIRIASTVATIGSKAFMRCPALATINIKATVPPVITPNTFDDITYSSTTLFVPYGCLQAYKADTCWGQFAHIVELDTRGDVNGDGETDIGDINDLIEAILTGESKPSLDVDGDGNVNIADVNLLIDLI